MNISGMDLNLLVVFDAVMSERSVTGASRKIHLTQPAVSNALTRLRVLLKDDLFVRASSGMVPTPRAFELASPIRNALMGIETALNPTDFNAKTQNYSFTMAVTDYAAAIILPKLAEMLERDAPGIDLRTVPNDNEEIIDLLDSHQVDFAIGGCYPPYPERLRYEILFEESYVCLMRKTHKLAKSEVSYDDFVSAKHLRFTQSGVATSILDKILAKQGVKRRIPLTVNQFLVAPLIIQSTDTLMVLAKRLVDTFQDFQSLHQVKVPVELPKVEVMMMWHNRLGTHPAHEWMRLQLKSICKNI